jgi:hypothetical protein
MCRMHDGTDVNPAGQAAPCRRSRYEQAQFAIGRGVSVLVPWRDARPPPHVASRAAALRPQNFIVMPARRFHE